MNTIFLLQIRKQKSRELLSYKLLATCVTFSIFMCYLLSSSPHVIPAKKFQVNQLHVSLLICKDYLPGTPSVENRRENLVHFLEEKDVLKKQVFTLPVE